jgi:hypothetical protein
MYQADPVVQPDELLQLFQPCISDEANEHLCKEFSEQEIANALFQMGPLKAPWPDSCKVLSTQLGDHEGGCNTGCAGVLQLGSNAAWN